MFTRTFQTILIGLLAISIVACQKGPTNPDLILATTTSTRDSGWLEDMIPVFEKETGYKVKVVAVGSGAALQMGQEGNDDVLLVHSPSAEKTFVEGGFGVDRK